MDVGFYSIHLCTKYLAISENEILTNFKRREKLYTFGILPVILL